MKPGNKLLIKNMVCPRCISSIEGSLAKLDIPYSNVQLGEVELLQGVPASKLEAFDEEIRKQGFELIETRINKIIEDIKKFVLQYIAGLSSERRVKLSVFITQTIHYDYSYLSDLFSSIEGITIEQFFLLQRMEKVKELLVYEQLTLTEIAFETGFSSVAHLSSQFKKITGLTASHFKKIGMDRRKSLDVH